MAETARLCGLYQTGTLASKTHSSGSCLSWIKVEACAAYRACHRLLAMLHGYCSSVSWPPVRATSQVSDNFKLK